MRKYVVILLTTLIILAGCSSPVTQGPGVLSPATVPFKDVGASDQDLRNDPEVLYGYAIAKTKVGFDKKNFEALGATVVGKMSLGDTSVEYWRLYKPAQFAKFMSQVRHYGDVFYIEPDTRIQAVQPRPSSQAAASRGLENGNLLNDPEITGADYALTLTKALDAYKTLGYGTNKVLMAIIDTGINMAHEDFTYTEGGAQKSVIRYAKSAFNKAADGTMTWIGDGNAFVTIPAGENWDDEAHGTHCAGTMAALGNNGKGVAGVAWKNTEIISYKCFANSTSGSGAAWSVYGSLGDLAAYVKDQRSNGLLAQATVPVNMSLGGSYTSAFALDMVNFAINQGILPVVAMGNDGRTVTQYPAALPGVMAIGATDGRDEKVRFSNSGSWISVSAPGYDIKSAGNGGTSWNSDGVARQKDYQWMSGTSMATPFVTGMIGYLLSFNPNLKPYEIKAIIEQTADDKGPAGFDVDYGYGRVNVLKAAEKVKNGPLPTSWPYVNTTLKIAAVNDAAHYNSGIAAYPKALAGQIITLYKQDGTRFVSVTTNDRDGSAEVHGVPAGTYVLRSNYLGSFQQVNVTVSSSADSTVTLHFNVEVMHISTVPSTRYQRTAGTNDSTDTIISLYKYNPAGASDAEKYVLLADYDSNTFDTYSFVVTPGAQYLAAIKPYKTDIGNYVIQIGYSKLSEASNAEDGATPARLPTANDSHESDNTPAEGVAKGAFTLDTPFAANLVDSADIDFFLFAAP